MSSKFFKCKGCEDRHPGCHGSCVVYKRACAEWEKAKKYIHEDDDIIDYKNHTYHRLRKRYD